MTALGLAGLGALPLAAASAASSASGARPGGFDPATLVPWAVPFLLVLPFLGWVLLVFGPRTRRGAANLGMLTVALTLASALVVAWARFRQAAPYKVSYQWINVPVAFTGEPRFQGFGIDLAFSVDHVALAALTALLVIVLACLLWHRVGARGEQGPVRYQVNTVFLVLGAAGVVVSGDLVELLAFWLAAGLGTYLLLGHRWGTEGAGQRSRLALAVPFLGDVALLCAVALLYSRYGTLTLDTLLPELSTTLGVGLKSLTVAALLVFAAAFVRAGLWPFTAWQTGTVDAPPASLAMAAGIWPILSGVLLLRLQPLMSAAGWQAPRTALIALSVAAVAGPLLSLVGVELRRSLVLASSGAVALTLLGVLEPGSLPLAFTAVLAVAAARAAVLLAGAAVAAAMRTVDLRAMGAGWQRMPLSTAVLLAGSVVLSLAGLGPALLRSRDLVWLAFAAGLALTALATLRVYFAVAHGPLRRRRAFEPERVREAAGPVAGAALATAALGLAALVLAFFTPWVAFLRAGSHAVTTVGTNVLWIAAPLAGAALAAGLFWRRKDEALSFTARLGELFGALWELGGVQYDRFFARPGGQVVRAVEDVGLPTVETEVGRAIAGTGRLAGLAERSLPWVPAALGVAVALVVAFGLLSQGVLR
jgi:NADH:ubiquinone oxidoreductase subunit 5 (subunit L)/multisubunit Na+/H+ antiporter MnhA subunit